MNRRLPRPVFANIETVLCAIESGAVDEQGFPLALRDLDKNLADAAGRDMRKLISAVLSHFGGRKTAEAHGYRTRQILTCFGWIPVHYAYIRRAGTSALLGAVGVVAGSTTAARDWVVHCAVLCGSFAEGRAMLRRLTSMDVSVSKLRKMALAYGEQCLITQNRAGRDVRSYPKRVPNGGETQTAHTLFCMVDGTGAPCTKKDTVNTKGKHGEAGTRQIRVILFGEYEWLDKNGRPTPFKNSFSYAVSGDEIAEASVLVRKLGIARGCATATRMQCVADGEVALEKALRDGFPNATFTNDFMHACGYVHTCCENLGLSDKETGKEYRFLRGLLYRCGATAVIKRIENRYAKALEDSQEAEKALNYIRKREDNMRYGELRKAGLFIASGHVEAAARVLVVRRCKQAGMHWRHKNAIRISAILAQLRSAA